MADQDVERGQINLPLQPTQEQKVRKLSQWWERSPSSTSSNVARVRFRRGARFSKVPKRFHSRKVVAKSQTLIWLRSCFIHIFLILTEVSFRTRSFRRMLSSVFRYRWTKNGFTGPESFRGFRETGPCCHMCWFSPGWEGFSLGSLQFFSLHKKATFPNSNLIRTEDPQGNQLRS